MRFLITEKLGPHKFKTPEGYLICTDAILSRTGKQEYKRCEIFGDACDEPDKIVNVDRVDAEVFSDKAMASFENKPICIEHPDHDVNAENHNELAVGFVRDVHKGEDNGHPVMMGTLVITDKDAVEAVESGEYKELSCGYDCDIDDDDNPQQRNIRGNHVALCKHGRAGIARIVDSVKDVNDLTKFKMALRNISKMYSNDPGIEYVTSVLRNLGYEVTVDSIDGWRENKNVPGEHIKKYRMNVTLEGKEHHFLVELYADMGVWKVKEINAYMLDSNNIKQGEHMKDTKLQDKYVLYQRAGVWYGTKQENYEARIQNANAIQSFKAFNSVNDIIEYLSKYGNISKEDIIVKDFVKDEDFSRKTKQGFRVLEMYRDGGRLHVIFKRANDFGIGLGYDTTDGQWSQGRYNFSTLEKARQALMEEKPYARRIQDSVNDDNWSSVEEENYNKANKAVGAKDETEKNFKIYVKNIFGAYKVADWPAVSKEAAVKEFLEMNPAYRNKGIIEARDSVSDSKKEQLFTVEYEQDGVMYVRKVRASSIEDAISKVKDVYNKFEHETDKEYLKSSINEMSSYISNWSFMTTREKRNISPEGLGALKQMLKFAQQRLAELK